MSSLNDNREGADRSVMHPGLVANLETRADLGGPGSHPGSLRRRFSALVLAPLSLAVGYSWAGCELKQMEIPVRVIDRRPIAKLTLNGTEVPMLVDSGAFFSMLSASTAEQLKLEVQDLPRNIRIDGYVGGIEAMLTRVKKVDLIGAELTDIEFIVGGNELNAGIKGILGRNVLAAADTEYDLANGVVRLSFPKGECEKTNFAHWAGQAPVIVEPLDREGRGTDTAIRLDVSINGKRTLAMLDTGASRTIMTSKAARRAGIEESDLKPYGRTAGAGSGIVKVWTGRVNSFELGGEKIKNSTFEIADNLKANEGMLLGLDYFLSHRIYVSRLQRQVYITWNGGPVFSPYGAAPTDQDTRDAAVPQEVAGDDAEALARRGAATMAAGNYQRALQYLNRACELAPTVADNFYARGRLHSMMRNPRLALADYDEALRIDPTLDQARFQRIRVRLQLDDHPGATSDLDQLDATLPPSAGLRVDVGRLYADMDQVSKALRQYELWERTHSSDVRLASVLNERCWLRTRLNLELPLALRDCKQSVDKDGGDVNARDSLGWVYLRLGEAEKAKRSFNAAIELSRLSMSLYGRALAQLQLNDVASSEQDLAAARKLDPKIDETVRKMGFDLSKVHRSGP